MNHRGEPSYLDNPVGPLRCDDCGDPMDAPAQICEMDRDTIEVLCVRCSTLDSERLSSA